MRRLSWNNFRKEIEAVPQRYNRKSLSMEGGKEHTQKNKYRKKELEDLECSGTKDEDNLSLFGKLIDKHNQLIIDGMRVELECPSRDKHDVNGRRLRQDGARLRAGQCRAYKGGFYLSIFAISVVKCCNKARWRIHRRYGRSKETSKSWRIQEEEDSRIRITA